MNSLGWYASSKRTTGSHVYQCKRPDGAALIPWARGQLHVRSVTIVDADAEYHLCNTTTIAGEAANTAAAKKISKYINLYATHIFFPVTIEKAGMYNNLAIELMQKIGKRIYTITKEPLERMYLFQRISMAFQEAMQFLPEHFLNWRRLRANFNHKKQPN